MKPIMIIPFIISISLACSSGGNSVAPKVDRNSVSSTIPANTPTSEKATIPQTLEEKPAAPNSSPTIKKTIAETPRSIEKPGKPKSVTPVRTSKKVNPPKPAFQDVPESKEEFTVAKLESSINEIKPVAQPIPIEETTPVANSKASDSKVAASISHEIFDGLLKKYVSATGKVNYKGLLADKALFQSYLDLLASQPVQSSQPRNEQMAYWINAYNAFTIKLIMDNYPINSITDLNGGKPWDQKWIKLGTKTYSLNQIEHEILRPQFKDARIHFAVNCAAKSCPPLLNKAWTAANLESNLEHQTKSFINNPAFNQLDGTVKVSKIFDWYGEDFGDLKAYLQKYSGKEITGEILFSDYNWKLNE